MSNWQVDPERLKKLTKLSDDLHRIYRLLDGYDQPSLRGSPHSIYLSVGWRDGAEMYSYDFDNQISDHLLPYLKVFLDMRKKALEEEMVTLLNSEEQIPVRN